MDANAILMTKLILAAVTNIAGMWFLVWYEVNRKWNKDDLTAKGMAAIPMAIARYRVAFIIAAILVPEWVEILPGLFK